MIWYRIIGVKQVVSVIIGCFYVQMKTWLHIIIWRAEFHYFNTWFLQLTFALHVFKIVEVLKSKSDVKSMLCADNVSS